MLSIFEHILLLLEQTKILHVCLLSLCARDEQWQQNMNKGNVPGPAIGTALHPVCEYVKWYNPSQLSAWEFYIVTILVDAKYRIE